MNSGSEEEKLDVSGPQSISEATPESMLELGNMIHKKFLAFSAKHNELEEKYGKLIDQSQDPDDSTAQQNSKELVEEFHSHADKANMIISLYEQRSKLAEEIQEIWSTKETRMIQMIVHFCTTIMQPISKLIDPKYDPKDKIAARSEIEEDLRSYFAEMEEKHEKLTQKQRGKEEKKEKLNSLHEDLVRGLSILVELLPTEGGAMAAKKHVLKETHKSIDSVHGGEVPLVCLNSDNLLNVLSGVNPGFFKIREGLNDLATMVKQAELAKILGAPGCSPIGIDENEQALNFRDLQWAQNEKNQRENQKKVVWKDSKAKSALEKKMKSYLVEFNNNWKKTISLKAQEKLMEISSSMKSPLEIETAKNDLTAFCSSLAYSETCLALEKALRIEEEAELILQRAFEPFYQKAISSLDEIKKELRFLLFNCPLSAAFCLEEYSKKEGCSKELGQQLKTLIQEHAEEISKLTNLTRKREGENSNQLENLIKEIRRTIHSAKKTQGTFYLIEN